MNGTLSKVLIFAAGVAIGSAATWKYFKTKYETMAMEEIEAVREFYRQTESEPVSGDTCGDSIDEEMAASYCDHIRELGYSEEVADVKRPYVITPEEFGEHENYDTIELTYYDDGVLAEGGEIIENADQIIGKDSLRDIGKYEDDAVHVRNDELKCDYEILVDLRNYHDVYPPRKVE